MDERISCSCELVLSVYRICAWIDSYPFTPHPLHLLPSEPNSFFLCIKMCTYFYSHVQHILPLRHFSFLFSFVPSFFICPNISSLFLVVYCSFSICYFILYLFFHSSFPIFTIFNFYFRSLSVAWFFFFISLFVLSYALYTLFLHLFFFILYKFFSFSRVFPFSNSSFFLLVLFFSISYFTLIRFHSPIVLSFSISYFLLQ